MAKMIKIEKRKMLPKKAQNRKNRKVTKTRGKRVPIDKKQAENENNNAEKKREEKNKKSSVKIVEGGKTEDQLLLRQEKFCQLFVEPDKEFFANGFNSYVEAYEPDRSKKNRHKSAMASASRLLRNVKVIDRINNLLEEMTLNDQFVDKQLAVLITQHADFKAKLGAIKEYNQLKNRITKRLDVTTKGEALILTPEQKDKVQKLLDING